MFTNIPSWDCCQACRVRHLCELTKILKYFLLTRNNDTYSNFYIRHIHFVFTESLPCACLVQLMAKLVTINALCGAGVKYDTFTVKTLFYKSYFKC
uniref:Uncharacterized protein n=1 Tax=Pararge aegeria TaxID=116150 RepID=S4PMC0_9NEOP